VLFRSRVNVGVRQFADVVEAGLRELSCVTEVTPISGATDACAFEVRGPFDKDLVGAIDKLAREKSWELTELHESRFSLEDTFIALTRRAGEHQGVA